MTEGQFRRAKVNNKFFDEFEKVVDREVLVNIRQDDNGDSVKAFKDALKKLKEQINRLTTLEISKISEPQLLEGFKLEKQNGDWDPRSIRGFQERFVLPYWIRESLEHNEDTQKAKSNLEVVVRSRTLDVLYNYAVYEERRNTNDTIGTYEAYQEVKRQALTPTVSLDLETTLHYNTTIDSIDVMVNGRADYAVWYDQKSDKLATNLVIAEAKAPGAAVKGINQCFGYMAVVHRTREDHCQSDNTVFGISSDGRDFYFLKIAAPSEMKDPNAMSDASPDPNVSVISQSDRFSWPEDGLLIWSTIRSMVRAAGLKSPMNTRNPTDETAPAVDQPGLRIPTLHFPGPLLFEPDSMVE
ncbi:hypothetical protein BJX76DRAFT_354735 [Aspergillus varians]